MDVMQLHFPGKSHQLCNVRVVVNLPMPSGDTTNNAAGVIAISVNMASRLVFKETLRPFKALALLLLVVSGIVQYRIIPRSTN